MWLRSGGIEADNAVCREGKVAHMKTSSENRWQAPLRYTSIKAFWIRTSSFDKFDQTALV